MDHKGHTHLVHHIFVDLEVVSVALFRGIHAGWWCLRFGQGFSHFLVGVEVVEGVCSRTDGVDERPGVLNVAVVTEHFLLELGPCFAVIGFVEDGPVVGCPLGCAEQGGRSFGKGDFVRPAKHVFHAIDASAPSKDVGRVRGRLGRSFGQVA